MSSLSRSWTSCSLRRLSACGMALLMDGVRVVVQSSFAFIIEHSQVTRRLNRANAARRTEWERSACRSAIAGHTDMLWPLLASFRCQCRYQGFFCRLDPPAGEPEKEAVEIEAITFVRSELSSILCYCIYNHMSTFQRSEEISEPCSKSPSLPPRCCCLLSLLLNPFTVACPVTGASSNDGLLTSLM